VFSCEPKRGIATTHRLLGDLGEIMSFYSEMRRQKEESEHNIRNVIGVETFKSLMESTFEQQKQGECCQTCDRILKCNCPIQGKVDRSAKSCIHYKAK